MASDLISVLLVEDHPLLRRVLRRCIEDDPQLVVVGEANEGAQAVRLASELKPTVIVMDLVMPGMDGLQASERILGLMPRAAILMLSLSATESAVTRARQVGVRGFLLKNAANLPLAEAIHRVANREAAYFRWLPAKS